MSAHSVKAYLGDSVYADFDGHDVVLTTENGMGPSNTIVLEPEVMTALKRWLLEVELMFAVYKAPREEPKP